MKILKNIVLGDLLEQQLLGYCVHSPIPVLVFGDNNDGDKCLITKFAMEEGSSLEVGFETFDILEIDDRKLFLTHFPMLAKPMASSKQFDAVFYGHNHLKIKKNRRLFSLNPGEVGAYKTGVATFAVYDTKTNDAEIIEIDNSITTNTKESQKKI